MKRLIFLILAIMPVAVLADGTSIGIHAGAIIPLTSFMTGTYSTSPMAGANILIPMSEYTIEGSISFVLLRDHSSMENFSASMIPFLVGLRGNSGPLFFGGGGAIHFVTERYDDPVHGKFDESSSLTGAYLNAGLPVPLMGSEVELAVTYHLVDLTYDKSWLGVTAGYHF